MPCPEQPNGDKAPGYTCSREKLAARFIVGAGPLWPRAATGRWLLADAMMIVGARHAVPRAAQRAQGPRLHLFAREAGRVFHRRGGPLWPRAATGRWLLADAMMIVGARHAVPRAAQRAQGPRLHLFAREAGRAPSLRRQSVDQSAQFPGPQPPPAGGVKRW